MYLKCIQKLEKKSLMYEGMEQNIQEKNNI